MRGRAAYAEDGRPVSVTGVSLDITPRKQAEQRQQAMVAELNHRVKNTLATMQSIALQTRRGAGSVDDFSDKLTARIGALARVHDILVEAGWDGALLADVVRAELGQSGEGADRARDHWSAVGPGLWLNPNAAVTLAMVFHELAGNAARHGALSVPGGHVSVGWEIGADGAAILWRESGGPAVPTVVRRGFGSRLVEQGVRTELGGRAELDYLPDGLVYRLSLPFSAKIRPAA